MRKIVEERTLEYDEKGRCVHMVCYKRTNKGRAIDAWFLYDSYGRLVHFVSTDGIQIYYFYDESGKLISAGDGWQTETFKYGEKGKLISSRKQFVEGFIPMPFHLYPFYVLYSQQSILKTGGIFNAVFKTGTENFNMQNTNMSFVIDSVYDDKERLINLQIGLWKCTYEYDEKDRCVHSITSDGCETWYECNDRGDVIQAVIEIPDEVFKTPAENVEQ